MGINLQKYPDSKSEYLFTIAKILAMDHGAFQEYTSEQVKQAHLKSIFQEYNCLHWAVAVYCTKAEFENAFPDKIGDYEMLREELIVESKSTLNENTHHWAWLEIAVEVLEVIFKI